MNAKTQITMVAVVFLVCTTAFISPAFCHSSELQSTSDIRTVNNMVDVFNDDADETVHWTSITTSSVAGKSSSSDGKTTYSYTGTVSKDLFIRMTGDVDSYIGVALSGCTADVVVEFYFDGSETIVLSSTNGWTGKTSCTYAVGEKVAFTIKVTATASATKTPTLGSVTFTMDHTDGSEVSSVTISSNPITVELSSIISNDDDVVNSLAEVNQTSGGKTGVTGTTTKSGNTKSADFKFITNGNSDGTYGVYITNSNSSSNPNVVDKNTSFEFDLVIPAGQRFCIKFELATALIADNNVTMTANGVSGKISLQSGAFTTSQTYAWLQKTGNTYSLTSSSNTSDVTYMAYDEDITLHFDGQRTAGWLTDGQLKIQILMI